MSLALLGWVKFYESPATAGVITIVSSICIIIWLIHTIPNWGNSAIQHVSKYDEHEMPPTPPNGLDGMGDGNASRDTMMDLRGIIDASDDGVCKAGKEDIDVGVGMMRETSTNDTVHNGTHSNRDEHTSHHINGEGDGKGVEEMGTSAKLMRGLSSYFLGSSTHTNNNSSSNARQSPSRSQQYRPNEQSTHPHRHAQSPASEQQHMSSFSDGMDAFGRFHNAHYHNQMRRHQYHRNRHHSQAGSPARADGE